MHFETDYRYSSIWFFIGLSLAIIPLTYIYYGFFAAIEFYLLSTSVIWVIALLTHKKIILTDNKMIIKGGLPLEKRVFLYSEVKEVAIHDFGTKLTFPRIVIKLKSGRKVSFFYSSITEKSIDNLSELLKNKVSHVNLFRK